MSTRAFLPLLVAGALGLAACGGGDSGSSDATVPSDADLTITGVEGLMWDAPSYTATAGEITIAVVNDSSQPHNLHIVDSGGVQLPDIWNIPSKGSIDTRTVTLAAGTYTLICTIPGHVNMKAELTVS
jgi:plastocyanin